MFLPKNQISPSKVVKVVSWHLLQSIGLPRPKCQNICYLRAELRADSSKYTIDTLK